MAWLLSLTVQDIVDSLNLSFDEQRDGDWPLGYND